MATPLDSLSTRFGIPIRLVEDLYELVEDLYDALAKEATSQDETLEILKIILGTITLYQRTKRKRANNEKDNLINNEIRKIVEELRAQADQWNVYELSVRRRLDKEANEGLTFASTSTITAFDLTARVVVSHMTTVRRLAERLEQLSQKEEEGEQK